MIQIITPPEVIEIPDDFPPVDIESDEPELESSVHLYQIFLLLSCLELLWQERNDYFAAGNLTIYYKQKQNKAPECRGPDFFVVLGTQKRDRKSWVVYHEGGIYPHVIVEILSDSTAGVDRTTKKLIYQDTFRTPDYFWFHPETLEFQGFSLLNGQYVDLEPNDRGWLWSQQLGLFLGIHDQKLRYFTESGELVPSPDEARIAALAQVAAAEQQANLASQRAEVETQRAEMEAQRAERETQRAEVEAQRAEEAIAQLEKLAAKLRELNIDPEQI
ncbi:MAG: Uma2 family endonuclease [Coleofasciculaceae cyanobacterium SM2_1_6]|nr:Uma2 family endonuclease [Coleofasciculaceae cyanobacterium SM2_1_6]